MIVLNNFDEVVRALGGTFAVARIIGCNPPMVCQWRQRYGAFHASHYFVINDALLAAGFTASRNLFRFVKTGRAGNARRKPKKTIKRRDHRTDHAVAAGKAAS